MNGQSKLGIFPYHKDIGNPTLNGSSSYDEVNQQYFLEGSGYNIWFERDEFHYLYDSLEGNFILTAQFEFVGEGTDPHRKIGWMVRSSEDEQAMHISSVLHGDGLTTLQWRTLRGAFMRDPEDEIFAPKKAYQILQLERKENTFIMRAAHMGEPLQVIGMKTLDHFPDKVLGGLFICAHNSDVSEKAKMRNVRIDFPVDDDYNPYDEGWLGCRMEIMNVFDGHRKVIFEKDNRFEAPNWMPSGDKLLFNMEGHLYTIPVTGGQPNILDTGEADRNNNDHGISFDGTLLAISNHRQGFPDGGSTVYVLPITGGNPTVVTDSTPSYWHGWAPNNEKVIYVAKRSGSEAYNIYQKSIHGGDEEALTQIGEGEHVDGCEYSPDGEYIYYNGNHTGTMQIWRMKPDGSDKEQLTFDSFNDWFPHISPDGQWIAFLSYPADIPPNSHPSFKRVQLRLMKTDGSALKTIAHLYGGQGTINVPSWSPDSKNIAFVSNSGKIPVLNDVAN